MGGGPVAASSGQTYLGRFGGDAAHLNDASLSPLSLGSSYEPSPDAGSLPTPSLVDTLCLPRRLGRRAPQAPPSSLSPLPLSESTTARRPDLTGRSGTRKRSTGLTARRERRTARACGGVQRSSTHPTHTWTQEAEGVNVVQGRGREWLAVATAAAAESGLPTWPCHTRRQPPHTTTTSTQET